MKYGNEIKVGAALVLAALIFYIGVQYFQDIPLFKGTYDLETSFDDAGGLLSGSAVRINGVNVGSVDKVSLRPGSDQAHVRFHVDNGTEIPVGSTTSVGGLAALGVVRLDIELAEPSGTIYRPGDFVPSSEAGLLDQLMGRAPALVGRADTLLGTAATTLTSAQALLASPQSDLNRTLRAIQGSADALNALLRAEQARLGAVLAGVDTLVGNLNAFTGTQGDSLGQAVQNLNTVLARVNANLASLETTTASLDAVVAKIDRGEGTLGLLVNDPGLYNRLDTTLLNLNRILLDFEQNPKRYLKDLKLVDVF